MGGLEGDERMMWMKGGKSLMGCWLAVKSCERAGLAQQR